MQLGVGFLYLASTGKLHYVIFKILRESGQKICLICLALVAGHGKHAKASS